MAEHTLPPSAPLPVVTGDQPLRDLHHQVVKPGPDHSEEPFTSWEADEVVPLPTSTESLNSWLTGYDPKEPQFLIQGFTHSFRLMYEGPSTNTFAKRLFSVMTQRDATYKTLATELHLYRMAGPFESPPLAAFLISPLGLIPKREPGEYRLIHDLSPPAGSSLNEFIDSEHRLYSTRHLTILFSVLYSPAGGPYSHSGHRVSFSDYTHPSRQLSTFTPMFGWNQTTMTSVCRWAVRSPVTFCSI